jgi:hypothetical protein
MALGVHDDRSVHRCPTVHLRSRDLAGTARATTEGDGAMVLGPPSNIGANHGINFLGGPEKLGNGSNTHRAP